MVALDGVMRLWKDWNAYFLYIDEGVTALYLNVGNFSRAARAPESWQVDGRSLCFVVTETTTNTTDLKVVFQVTVSGGFKVTPR